MACVGGIDTVTGQPCSDPAPAEDTREVVDFGPDGTPILYDSATDQFFIREAVPGPGGAGGMTLQERILGPGHPLLAQVFGKSLSGGLQQISPTALAQIQEDARQFNASLEQRKLELEQGRFDSAEDRAIAQARLEQDDRQFQAGLNFDVARTNAAAQQSADEANQAAALRVAEVNAGLRAQQAELGEQIRQADIQDARERENMRFLLRKEQVATEEGNRSALQSAVALREQISSRIESNRLQRQGLVTQVDTINAQIENNTDQFNAQEQARVEELNEQRRQANLRQLQSVSRDIGTLAQNPADVGKLAAFLRSGNPAAISDAVARGEDAITTESLTGLRGLLGVREGLLGGPTEATANLIESNLVDRPEFANDLGLPPDIADLFQAINFDPTGIQRGDTPAAADISQFFQGIGLPPEIEAQLIAQMSSGGASQIPAGTAPAQIPAAASPAAQTAPTVASNIDAGSFGGPGVGEITPENQATLQNDVNVLLEDSADPDRTQDFLRQLEEIAQRQAAERAGRLEFGGTAAPGTPVIVGDSSDGKENQELAMVDAMGNLVVTPLDQLPKAQDGGLFRDLTAPSLDEALMRLADPSRETAFPSPGQTGGTFRDISAGSFDDAVQRLADPNRETSFLSDARSFNPTSTTIGDASTALDRFPLLPAGGVDPIFNSTFLPSGGALTPDQVIPPQQTAAGVRQTAQNPGGVGPVSEEIARLFLNDVQQDALRRGGFTDPRQVSPIKVSAPGTSRFLQDLSASVAGTLGFGPSQLFFEELQRLRPQGVRRGVARRTG